MGTIAIEGMKFYAFHGYYKEEQILGGNYLVDVYLETDFSKAGKSDKLSQTINYEEVFELVKKVMEKKVKLLEHLAENISSAIFKKYKSIQKIKVRVSKLNPPLNGKVEKVFVENISRREHKDNSRKVRRVLLLLFLVFFFSPLLWRGVGGEASAQFSFKQQNFPVTAFLQTLKSPWAGGLNNPQFSSIDLNNDGKEDLFVFDRNGNKVLTFLNQGTTNNVDFIYASQYENIFPPLQNWVLLIDFNCDGVKDIFTSSNFGIAVYQGKKDGSGNLSFTLFSSELQYGTSIKIPIAEVDIPSITDVNNDGDLDILTFPGGGGLMVLYYENQSVEKGFGCDSLTFELLESCWGKFAQTTVDKSVQLGISCKGISIDQNNSAHHGTNATVAFDKDGDGDKDFLFGDFNFNNFNLLTNGGTPTSANITTQDTAFPKNSLATLIDRLPAPFYLDVDNDGKNDLLAAPNSPNNSMNNKNVWFYKNTGTSSNAIFTFQNDSFLVSDMIDVGESANPVFFDYNADSLPDLLIGNYQLKNNPSTSTSGISLYKNIGTRQSPAYEFVTNNFAGLSFFADFKSIMPAFGDLDGDGDKDMLIGAAEGSNDGFLYYFQNTAGAGNPANFVLTQPQFQGIDVGQFSTPQLADVNRDGKLDLLMGERNGNLNYYENTGTTSAPVFTLISGNFGGVDVGGVTGYSVPFLTKLGGADNYYLLVGSERGYIYLYGNIDGNLTGNFTLLDSMFLKINEGLRASISGEDINSDGKIDLVIGNNRGGMKIFVQDSLSDISENISEKLSMEIFPNPANNWLRITKLDEYTNGEVRIYNLLGKEIYHRTLNLKLETLNFNFPNGIYFCKIIVNDKTVTKKLVVQH